MESELKTTIDHEEIRIWIEEHDGVPVLVNSRENDGQGVLAIRFDDTDAVLESISWQEFFDTFDSSKLAFRYNAEEEHPDMFSYNFIQRGENYVETEHDSDNNDLPEEGIPIENLYPSASEMDINPGAAELDEDSELHGFSLEEE